MRVLAGFAFLFVLSAIISGCGDDTTASVSVQGAWNCLVDSEEMNLDLQQDGRTVSGMVCENSCDGTGDEIPLQDGQASDDLLTFFYTFDTTRCEVILTLADEALTGTWSCGELSAAVTCSAL